MGEDSAATGDKGEAPKGGENLEPKDGEQAEPKKVNIVAVGGKDGSQPEHLNAIVRKRVNKLNSRNDKLAATNDNLTGDLATANQRIGLMQMQIDQLNAGQKTTIEAPKPPDPINFDEGAGDPKYIAALDEYVDRRTAATVKRQLSEQPNLTPTLDRTTEAKQTAHYERAHKLGATDFDEVEGIAIDGLGKAATKAIIKEYENSELIMYYLGKNPGQLEYFRDLFATDPVHGVRQLDRLKLEDANAVGQNNAPNPDEPLEGAVPAGTGANEYEKKLDQLRAQAAVDGNMDAVIAHKKKERDRLAAA